MSSHTEDNQQHDIWVEKQKEQVRDRVDGAITDASCRLVENVWKPQSGQSQLVSWLGQDTLNRFLEECVQTYPKRDWFELSAAMAEKYPALKRGMEQLVNLLHDVVPEWDNRVKAVNIQKQWFRCRWYSTAQDSRELGFDIRMVFDFTCDVKLPGAGTIVLDLSKRRGFTYCHCWPAPAEKPVERANCSTAASSQDHSVSLADQESKSSAQSGLTAAARGTSGDAKSGKTLDDCRLSDVSSLASGA